MHDTKKGKYTDEENETIIKAINRGLQEGSKEREIIKELSIQLNRGYAGIMSHVRKLRSEFPDRFHSSDDYDYNRLNSWEEKEEELVIQTVNSYLEKGKSLSAAISELERLLSRTQGAIYQRIYTLRRKKPERFNHLPAKRPRKRKQLTNWQTKRPAIRPINEYASDEQSTANNQQLASSSNPVHLSSSTSFNDENLNEEEQMVYKAFTENYGHPHPEKKNKLVRLMRAYGPTRVAIALFTISEDKEFPNQIINFLEQRLQNHSFI